MRGTVGPKGRTKRVGASERWTVSEWAPVDDEEVGLSGRIDRFEIK